MATPFLIAAGAGLVAGALFASAATATALAGILFYLAPLPICLAGLGWGWTAGFVAAAAGSVAVAGVLGLSAGLVFAGAIGFPLAALCYLALMSRPVSEGTSGQQGLEWYPPGRLVGWAAATGTIGIESIVLFVIIFMWTPPHFWALALYRARDYERAGVPMLPVVAGQAETRKQIVIYSAVLVPLALLPALMGFGGALYLLTSIALGGVLLALALRVYREREGRQADRAAKQMFEFSILYLFALFAALSIERGIALWTA